MMFLFVLWWFSASMSFRWFSGEYQPGWNCSHSRELNMGECSVILLTFSFKRKMALWFPQIKHWFPIVHMRIAFAARVIETSSTPHHWAAECRPIAAIETKIELRWWWHCLAHWLQTADNWGKAQLFVIDISDSFISIRCCWWNPTSHTSHQFRYSVMR